MRAFLLLLAAVTSSALAADVSYRINDAPWVDLGNQVSPFSFPVSPVVPGDAIAVRVENPAGSSTRTYTLLAQATTEAEIDMTGRVDVDAQDAEAEAQAACDRAMMDVKQGTGTCTYRVNVIVIEPQTGQVVK